MAVIVPQCIGTTFHGNFVLMKTKFWYFKNKIILNNETVAFFEDYFF